ncbi:unnamed protein product [Rangifer tarandus platyrhynchus]|uniref:Uncharacterized protein n=1 Tax=Rangifer tarandus platyrhynchus TaxID=3082113 RepID=A0ABN8YDD3_RANTA|nr:unnamed protein product [Rangifer tarandus platyrhynchus]
MLFDPRNVIRLESQGWTGVLVEPPPTAEPLISTRRPPRLCSPSQPLRSPSVSTRERSPQVPDPRGSKASTPTREGLAEAWPKPCSLGPRNPVVGQRHPGAERPPPLGCRETSWELGKWTHCSDTCGHLEARIQRPQCLMANGQEISEAFCYQLQKPRAAFQPCNNRDCPPEGRERGWGHWRPGFVGASNCVGCTQGAVGNFWGFAAGVSGVPRVTAVSGAKCVSGATSVSGIVNVAGGPLPRVLGVPRVRRVLDVRRVPWEPRMLQVEGGATGSLEVSLVSQVSGVPWVWWLSGVNDVQQVSGVQRIPRVQKMPLVKRVAPGSHKADGCHGCCWCHGVSGVMGVTSTSGATGVWGVSGVVDATGILVELASPLVSQVLLLS